MFISYFWKACTVNNQARYQTQWVIRFHVQQMVDSGQKSSCLVVSAHEDNSINCASKSNEKIMHFWGQGRIESACTPHQIPPKHHAKNYIFSITLGNKFHHIFWNDSMKMDIRRWQSAFGGLCVAEIHLVKCM